MNLFNLKAIILQNMAPHWRKESWKVKMTLVLLYPLQVYYNELLLYTYYLEQDLGVTPQVGVLENLLQRKLYISPANVFIAPSLNKNEFLVYLKNRYQNQSPQINSILKPYLPLGVRYRIVLF